MQGLGTAGTTWNHLKVKVVPPRSPCSKRGGTTGSTGTTFLLETPYIYKSRLGESLEKGGSRWGQVVPLRINSFFHVGVCDTQIGAVLPMPTERRARFPEKFSVAKRRGQIYA